jgi:hypothetical protein
MLFIVGNIFSRTLKYWACIHKKIWFEKDMNVQSFRITRIPTLGSPKEKWHLGVVRVKKHKLYYREGSGASSQRLWDVWNLCLRLSLLSSSHHFNSTYITVWLCKLITFWTLTCEFILVPSQSSNTTSYPQSVTN